MYVVPFGANIDEILTGEKVVLSRDEGPCRLLFVGQQWVRKGGQVAIATVVALNDMGIDAELTICGEPPPDGQPLPASVKVMGMLDKSRPKQSERLLRSFRESHFFVLPTRADCTPIACSEACAFGLPVMTTDTGGLPTIVENGVNGFRLPRTASGTHFAEKIAEIWRDAPRYRSLVESTRKRYDEHLNWDTWATRMIEILEGIEETDV